MFDRHNLMEQLGKQGLTVEQGRSVVRELERLEHAPVTAGDLARATGGIREAAGADNEKLRDAVARSTASLEQRNEGLGSRLGSQIASSHWNTDELRKAVETMEMRLTRRVIAAAAAATGAAALLAELFG